MGKVKASPVWTYYEVSVEDEGYAICNICQAKVSRGSKSVKNMTISNLKKHLEKKHAEQYEEFKKTDEENNLKKRKAEDDESEEEDGAANLGNKKKQDRFLQKALPDVMNLNVPLWKVNDPKN